MQQTVKEMPNVIFASNFYLKGNRLGCRGFLDYAHEHGPWRCLLLQEGRREGERLISLARLGVSGIAAQSLSRRDAELVASMNVPVVLREPPPEMLEPGHPLASSPYVKVDSYGVGVMAANYYLARGYKSFAYVGETLGMYWSADRRRGFEDTLKKAGFECTAYDRFSKRERRSWNAERPRMIRFLRELPKPTAIFAAMDERARLILDVCAEIGIGVPEEIAVLGVDDDTILCESSVPTLSSIRMGCFRRGQKAAEILDDLMHGRPVQQTNVVMEPLSVVTRESTGYDAMRNSVIARALQFIHSEACRRRIGVADVVQASGGSRRYVEQRFRKHLNASVRDVILRTKIERAQSLLEESNLSIGEIAEQCGNMNESHLAVLFKKATGLSMRDYRKRNHEPPDD